MIQTVEDERIYTWLYYSLHSVFPKEIGVENVGISFISFYITHQNVVVFGH